MISFALEETSPESATAHSGAPWCMPHPKRGLFCTGTSWCQYYLKGTSIPIHPGSDIGFEQLASSYPELRFEVFASGTAAETNDLDALLEKRRADVAAALRAVGVSDDRIRFAPDQRREKAPPWPEIPPDAGVTAQDQETINGHYSACVTAIGDWGIEPTLD